MKNLFLIVTTLLVIGMTLTGCASPDLPTISTNLQKPNTVRDFSECTTNILDSFETDAEVAGSELPEVLPEMLVMEHHGGAMAQLEFRANGGLGKHAKTLTIFSSCINFVADVVEVPTPNPEIKTVQQAPTPSPEAKAVPSPTATPNVTLPDRYATHKTTSDTVFTVTLGNCHTSSQNMPTIKFQLSFNISTFFNLSVGTKSASKLYQALPTGKTNLDLIGSAVINKYGLTAVGGSVKQVEDVQIVPAKKITFSLVVTEPYTYGLAVLNPNDPSSYVPWIFAGGTKTLQITTKTENC
jgi:hypothetical protein